MSEIIYNDKYPKSKMGTSVAEPLGSVIKRLVRALGAEKKILEISLAKRWGEIIGPNIERNTEKIYISENCVYVKFNTPILKQEMMLYKTELMKRFNKLAGYEFVKNIIYL